MNSPVFPQSCSFRSRQNPAVWMWEGALLGTALAGVGLAVKATLLPWQGLQPGTLLRWLGRLFVVAADDLGFALLMILVGWAMLWTVAQTFPRLLPVAMAALRAAFALALLYAVVSGALFRVTLQPFNIRVLFLVGRWDLLWSSVEPYLSWGQVGLALAVPVGAVWASQAAAKRLAQAWSFQAALGVVMGAWALWIPLDQAAAQYVQHRWPTPRIWENRLARSPHWVLLRSCWDRWRGHDPFAPLNNPSQQREDAELFQPPETLPPVARLLPGYRPPRHVVVVWMESVGAEYVSWAGGKWKTMPLVAQRIRRQGVVFRNFYVTAPYSCKSLWTLCSGTYPRPDWHLLVQNPPAGVSLLPQLLRRQGWQVCFAHSGYWSWRERDRFLRRAGVGQLLDASCLPGPRINSWGTSDRAMFEALLQWLARHTSQRTFALAYTIQTHHPYASPRQQVRFPVQDEELQQYLNAIRATDELLEWFLVRLEELGLLEETLVVISSDHGESFGQHDQREHHFALYEPNVRIPLALLYPGLKHFRPRVVRQVRSQVDLAPTILHLLGLEVPSGWQGTSLLVPDLQNRPALMLTVSNYAVLGLRWGRWKYHYWVEQGQEELYDLDADPWEEHDLAAHHAQLCRQFRRWLGHWVLAHQRFLRQASSGVTLSPPVVRQALVGKGAKVLK